jgi:23S rRNA pseudouridine1911/1915/1917 synthase
MAVLSAGGKRAVTRARVLERFGAGPRPLASLIECRLETGRTHQIRVHMTFAGHPLAGDAVYGRRDQAAASLRFGRQALHAAVLGFRHPRTGERVRFEASEPEDLAGFLADLRRLATE